MLWSVLMCLLSLLLPLPLLLLLWLLLLVLLLRRMLWSPLLFEFARHGHGLTMRIHLGLRLCRCSNACLHIWLYIDQIPGPYL